MAPPRVPPSSRRGLLRPLLVAGAYLVLVLGFTWPLPIQWGDHVVLARGADLWQNLWNFGWVRTALVDLHQSPYYTSSIFYPTGVPLAYHALNVFSATVSIPLQGLFGLVPAFNLLLFANLLAAALAAYWLARVLGLDVAPAFLAGLLFACSPPISTSFDNGQGELVSVFWLPLCVGLLLRGAGWRAPGLPPGSRWYLVGAGLALVGSALASYYWLAGLLVFIAVYSVLESWAAARAGGWPAVRPWLGRMALLGGVAALAVSPLLVLLVRALVRGGADLGFSRANTSDAVVYASSQDLLSLFLPMPSHVDPDQITWQGANLGIGWTVLALAALAVVLARGPQRLRLRLWGAAALVFALLALGPTLLVGGQAPGIPLPFAAIMDLPGAAAMRVPLRFLTPLALCMAILAAHGFSIFDFRFWIFDSRAGRSAASRIEKPKSKIRRSALLALALALVVVEFFDVPRPVMRPDVPPFVQALAAHPSPCNGAVRAPLAQCGAVLELPSETWVARAMFHQVLDQHPMIGGYTSRHNPDPFALEAPGVAQLVVADPTLLETDILTPALRTTAIQAMDYYGVRTVVVHSLSDYPAAAPLRRVLQVLFPSGGTPAGDATIYTVAAGAQDHAVLVLGDNWYDEERNAAGVRHRWANGEATLRFIVPPLAAGAYTLGLDVYSVAGSRTLVAGLDGRELARRPVAPAPQDLLRLPLTLTPGEHRLTLAGLEPAIRPPGDRRSLTLGYRAIVLTRNP